MNNMSITRFVQFVSFVSFVMMFSCLASKSFADLPVPVKSPNVQVGAPKAARGVYAPGEVAAIEVKVKNKGNWEIDAIVVLDIVLPDGATQQLRSDVQTVAAGKSQSVSVQYSIPADAPNGTYYARVLIRNPFVREPYYVDDALKVFEVKGGRKLDTEVIVKEKTAVSAVNWPGSSQTSSTPELSIPFAPKKKSLVGTLEPEFTWPKHPQAVSYKVYVSRVPFSGDNVILTQGVTDLKFKFDPSDASSPLIDGRSYSFTVLPKTADGATLVSDLDGFFSTFTVHTGPFDTSAVEVDPAADLKALKALLNALKDALINNDRVALMALIHPDWISTDGDFTDKSKFDNSIRDLFTKTTTTLITWSTENTDIISPGKRVTLTCTWRQKMTHTTFSATRDINTTLRLDVRKEDGKWLIREDLDNLIFRSNFGMSVSQSIFGRLPPYDATR